MKTERHTAKNTWIVLTGILMGCCLWGCGKNQEQAAVQSVAAICGYTEKGLSERFPGIAMPRKSVELKKAQDLTIESVLVETGDPVEEGQVLYTYDGERVSANLEKAKLEMEQLKNSVTTKNTQIQKLEKERQQASSDKKLSYTLEIQELEADIQEAEYNQTLKQTEIDKLTHLMENLSVLSPLSGTVQSIRDEDDDKGDSSDVFMVIMESGSLRIMGYINENSIGKLTEGMQVRVRSRIDEEQIWNGYLESIDWNHPVSASGSGTDGMAVANKYPFYLDLDNTEGILLGQHVYIEPVYDTGEFLTEGLRLAAGFICDAPENAWVWAENESGQLEKRNITLDTYLEDQDAYLILGGIAADDYIAYPSGQLKEGMSCIRYENAPTE